MAKHTLNKLSARAVTSATKTGRYSDGGGLHLVVSDNGARRRWVFRFAQEGRQRDMGIGSVREVTLADARAQATAAREHVRAGRDPIAERERARQAAQGVPTFGEMADQLIDGIESEFRNVKHRAQWRMTLTEYAKALRPLPVNTIKTEDVLGALQPIWQAKPETAGRLRGRIERVLDAARAKGFRTGENPARWRGHLDAILPRRQKLSRGHHAALPFDAVPDFMSKLRAMDGTAARALEFTILTAARSGEVIGALWPEVDLEARVWTVPASRMKAAREHRVPLSGRAIDILRAMAAAKTGDFIFAGAKPNKPQSSMALAMLLRRMNIKVTVHGFRSSFRDWAGERTHFPRELAEAALAHVVGDATERAYRRGDALERRREIMNAWAKSCEPKDGNVVPLTMRA
jgi:integrase